MPVAAARRQAAPDRFNQRDDGDEHRHLAGGRRWPGLKKNAAPPASAATRPAGRMTPSSRSRSISPAQRPMRTHGCAARLDHRARRPRPIAESPISAIHPAAKAGDSIQLRRRRASIRRAPRVARRGSALRASDNRSRSMATHVRYRSADPRRSKRVTDRNEQLAATGLARRTHPAAGHARHLVSDPTMRLRRCPNDRQTSRSSSRP